MMDRQITDGGACERLAALEALRAQGQGAAADAALMAWARTGELSPRLVWAMWRAGLVRALAETVSAGPGASLARALVAADRGDPLPALSSDVDAVDRCRCAVWQALLTRGDAAAAWAAYVALRPPTHAAADLALEARVHLASQAPERARAVLERAAFVAPQDPELLALNAALWVNEARRRREVRQMLERAAAALPAEAVIRANRVRLALGEGDLATARAEARQALDQRPWYEPPVQLLSAALYRAGKLAELQAWIEEAIAAWPGADRLAARLDVLQMRGASAAVLIEAAHAALQQAPQAPSVLLSAGNAFVKARALPEALACYRARLAQRPDDAATRANLAQVLYEAGDIAAALDEWHALGERCPAEALPNFGEALLQQGRFAQAVTVLERALARAERQARALSALARAQLGLGRWDAARALAQEAAQQDATHISGWLAWAEVALAAGQREEAQRILAQGIERVAQPEPLMERLDAVSRAQEKTAARLARLAQWVERYPQSARLLALFAEAAGEAGDTVAEAQALERLTAIDALVGGLARVRAALRRDAIAEATVMAQTLIAQYPTQMDVRRQLVEAFVRAGQGEAALALLPPPQDRPDAHTLELVRLRAKTMAHLGRWSELWEELEEPLSQTGASDLIALWAQAALVLGHAEAAFAQALARADERPWLEAAVELAPALGREAELIVPLKAALAQSPDDLTLHSRLLTCLARCGQGEVALARLDAMERQLGHVPRLRVARAEVLALCERPAEAAAELQAAWQMQPQSWELAQRTAEMWRRAGDTAREREATLTLMRQFPVAAWADWLVPHAERLGLTEALEAQVQAWHEREPANPQPLWVAYRWAVERRLFERALHWLTFIERRQPKSAQLWRARAACLSELWRMDEAIAAAKQAIALAPAEAQGHIDLLNLQAKAGDFSGFDASWQTAGRLLGERRLPLHEQLFFNVNCHPDWSAEAIWRFHADWYQQYLRPRLRPFDHWRNQPDPHRRLRIGYVSPDFRRHAVAYFSEPYLMGHDREQFELFAFAELAPGAEDAYTRRFRSYVHHWHNTFGMSDRQLAELVRRLEIDILIDLAGHTAHNRLKVLALRPAPIQVSLVFGAGQTTGIATIDVFVCDQMTCPPEHEAFMAERVWRWPFAGMPYRPPEDAPAPTRLPALSREEVVLGVMARPIRISPQFIAAAARILHAAPKARIRFDHVPYAIDEIRARLRSQFAAHGIGPERLIFCNTRPHWRAYQEIDLYLDTFPAGSGTTVTEALWMERLAVSLESRPIMGRAGAAQLAALALQEPCVAASEDDYVAKAVALIEDRQRLAALSGGLRARFMASVLYDPTGYGRAVASVLRAIWQDWCRKQINYTSGRSCSQHEHSA